MKKVNVTKLEVIAGLFMCTSFKCKQENSFAEPTVSFMVESKDKQTIVEWEVTYGAITIIEKCNEDYQPSKDSYETVSPHWYLGWCKGFGGWSQCAVDERELPKALVNGDFQHIKEVLEDYLGDY